MIAIKIRTLLLLLFLVGCFTSGSAQKNLLFTRSLTRINENAEKIKAGNTRLVKAKEVLLKKADQIIEVDTTYSVTYKQEKPPSGDLHDFYSLAKYWWPDPKQPQGKPFIRKDGKPYPGRKDIPDSDMLSNLGKDVYKLGLAYYFTGQSKYAEKAKQLLVIFFLNPRTKMNPHFEYAQIILGKGHSDGSLVSANPLIEIAEGIQLMQSSTVWSPREIKGIKDWYAAFLNWMLTSKTGQKQRNAKNNIGTYFTVQAATYALFSGQKELAKQILEKDAPQRINDQINADGQLAKELKRAKPWSYVMYDLDAFKLLVEVASKVDLDLWSYQAENGGSIQKAFAWLEPFADGKKKWTYNQKVTQRDIQSFLKKSGFYKSSGKFREGKISYLKTLEN